MLFTEPIEVVRSHWGRSSS